MAAYYYVGRDTHQIPVNFNSWSRDIFGYQHAFSKTGYEQINFQVDVRAEHAKLIRDHAAKSTVLLKNTNGTLPLSGNQKFAALFGEDAGDNPRGPNGCSDRGCDDGTLAMGWGSGTANFPNLISPLAAIQDEVLQNNGRIEWVADGFATTQIKALASQANIAIVFANADSGEGYISVDGNEGDRKNLTLWKNGDNVTETVASLCNNTILILHSVGPVLLKAYADHPNITAILWAGLPGEQSGNSIADVLFGRVNPGGKLPFTLGEKREDWGADLLSEPNNGNGAPQDNFSEGIFIDYRNFDKKNITPVYEFGYGLSYTTFEYSNLQIQALGAPPYTQNVGSTAPALQYGNSSKNLQDYQFPSNFTALPAYIYPYVNGTDAKSASGDQNYGASDDKLPAHAQDGSAQPKIRAGGAPGGNPRLYDEVYAITATVKNTGSIPGDEVPQVYISLGGPNDAPKVLRGFERITIGVGASIQFVARLSRRDIMNWNPVIQDWEITAYEKKVYVGSSSRKLPLSATLPALA
jgi:beta-glucosidase